MKQEMLKEVRYGLRNNRFLILAAFMIFFSIATPVMFVVVLPRVMMSQMPGMTMETLGQLMDMTQRGVLQSYMGDMFEIGSLVIALTLCGLLAQEIHDNTLVLPICSGKRFARVVLAKLMVFGLALLLLPGLSLLVCYLYAGMLLDFTVGLTPVLVSGLLQGLFTVFMLACLLLTGALLKKPIAAGLTTLLATYGLYALGSLFKLNACLPTGLLVEAQKLALPAFGDWIGPVAITIGSIALFICLTLLRLRRLEWNARAAG